MTNKLDEYMNYVVSEWMSENELAIDHGIRNEVTESFMSGLRELFENHYIEVPESKVDLIDALTYKVEKLTGKLILKLRSSVRSQEGLNIIVNQNSLVNLQQSKKVTSTVQQEVLQHF
jgi:hypothetical protein